MSSELKRRILRKANFDAFMEQAIDLLDLHTILEECQKEFPDLLLVTKDATVEDILRYVKAVYHWKDRWFGEQHSVITLNEKT